MILTISTTNDKLSYIVDKNPATITEAKKPFQRSLRKGNLYGWFTKTEYGNAFRLWFKDSEIDTSYGNQDFEYLDVTRYSDPRIPIGMISEAFRSCTKARKEEDTIPAVAEWVMYVPAVVSNRIFGNVGSNVTIEYTPIGFANDEHVRIKVFADNVFEALNWVQTICVLSAIKNLDTYIPLNEAGVTKYLTILGSIKAPYNVWAYFCSRAITSPGLFDKVKHLINNESQVLQYGNTSVQRRIFLESKLFTPDISKEGLIDLGCGEMLHTLRFPKHYDSILAIDKDPDLEGSNVRKINNKALSDKITYLTQEATPEWVKESASLFEGRDVILSEVLEHMPHVQATKLLRSVLKAGPKKVVVTLPNGTFNKHYNIPEGIMRHDEHLWEPSSGDVMNFLTAVLKAPLNRLYAPNYFEVGDVVMPGKYQRESCGHGIVFIQKQG